MEAIETQLLSENPQFSRIWVQYSSYRGFRVVITLFVRNNYTMIFGNVRDLTYDSINEVLQNHLKMN